MDVDVAKEIFSRLPVQSLLRFKCVSKLWMTLISEPYFKIKHLNHARNDDNSQKILVNQWYYHIDKVEQVQKLDCPDKHLQLLEIYPTLYCCGDGLALMEIYSYPNKHLQLLLRNPSTRESIVLPYPKIFPDDYCTWGLGYDSTSDDYKILKIDNKSRSEILALKSGSWRLMDKHPTDVHPMLMSTDSLYFRRGVQRDTIARATILEFLQTMSTNLGLNCLVYKAPIFNQPYQNICFRMEKCYCVADIYIAVLMYLGHPKDRLEYGLNLMSF
ncbi:hypothetical protein KY284_029785 [Solanum tuberosum]|nr:hypothetical protein KY284_029785 [Solanum tuberosum]